MSVRLAIEINLARMPTTSQPHARAAFDPQYQSKYFLRVLMFIMFEAISYVLGIYFTR